MKLQIAAVIATRGRGDLLVHLLRHLKAQTRPPDVICFSAVVDGDVGAAAATKDLPIKVVLGEAGLPAQRNRGVRAVSQDADVIVFFDDDFFPARSWLERAERVFLDNPSLLGVNGRTLADGALGPGIDMADAEQMLAKYQDGASKGDATVVPCDALYGCNMAFRAGVFAKLQFDEHLPLYGWLEDYDFSVRLRAVGPIAKSDALCGVHLGIKSGKTSGVRFGVSQIVNPVYLYRKGTIGILNTMRIILKPLLKNMGRALYAEPYIDRGGRLWGNLLGIASLLRGRADPRMILKLK